MGDGNEKMDKLAEEPPGGECSRKEAIPLNALKRMCSAVGRYSELK